MAPDRWTRRGLLRGSCLGLSAALSGCSIGADGWGRQTPTGERTGTPLLSDRTFETGGTDAEPVERPKEELYLYPADLPGSGWRNEIYPWAEKAFERPADGAIVGSSVYVYESVSKAKLEWDRFYGDDEGFLRTPELDVAVEAVRSAPDLFRNDQQQVVFRDANVMGTVRGILGSPETAFEDVAALAVEMHRKWR